MRPYYSWNTRSSADSNFFLILLDWHENLLLRTRNNSQTPNFPRAITTLSDYLLHQFNLRLLSLRLSEGRSALDSTVYVVGILSGKTLKFFIQGRKRWLQLLRLMPFLATLGTAGKDLHYTLKGQTKSDWPLTRPGYYRIRHQSLFERRTLCLFENPQMRISLAGESPILYG